MSLTKEQLELRRTGVTATDAVVLAGESPSRSRLDVFIEKTREVKPWGGNTATRIGEHMESLAMILLAEEQGLTLTPATTERHGIFSHILATPDRNVLDAPGGTRIAVAEAKMVGYRQASRWGASPPDAVIVQVTQQMMVTRTTIAHVAAIIGTEPRFYVVELDDTLASALLEMDDEFWRDHVVANIPPEPDATEASARALRQLYPRVRGDMFRAGPEIEEQARAFFAASRAEDEAKAAKLAAENALKAAIGEHAGVEGDGWRSTWSERKGAVSWAQAFKALAPNVDPKLVEQFRGEPTRTFRCDPK